MAHSETPTNPGGERSGAASGNERLAALMANAAAVVAIASAVEGTLGPKGLNTMLVDRYGEVTITNDGATILERMEINHPAAGLVIATARAQAEQVGDGTTTATLLAAALVSEGVKHVRNGVPVIKVIEGLRAAMLAAAQYLQGQTAALDSTDDPRLRQAALIAGRGDEQLADLAVQAAQLLGLERLRQDDFRLAETVVAKEGAPTGLVAGLVLEQSRMSRLMPGEVAPATVLLVDDALEPEEMEAEALGTEAGFQRYLKLQEEFRQGLEGVPAVGANCVFVRRGISDAAEELFTAAGVLAVRRVSGRDLVRLAEATGARPVKRAALRRPAEELRGVLGRAERVWESERLGHLQVLGGGGEPAVTLLVGAATREVRQERLRIAQDAAAALQAAVQGGVLAGGRSRGAGGLAPPGAHPRRVDRDGRLRLGLCPRGAQAAPGADCK